MCYQGFHMIFHSIADYQSRKRLIVSHSLLTIQFEIHVIYVVGTISICTALEKLAFLCLTFMLQLAGRMRQLDARSAAAVCLVT